MAGLLRLQTTRRDYGCAAGQILPPSPKHFSRRRRRPRLPSPTLALAPTPSPPIPPPPPSSSPSPSTLGRFYSRAYATQGLPQQLSTGKAGLASMRCFLQAASKEAGSPPSRFTGSVFCLQATTFAVLNKLSISSTSSAACNFNFFQAKAQTLTEAHCKPESAVPS
jgi:hypothetical protein